MPIRRSLTISLSPELLAVAERLLASGRYGNLSEVMRTALRHLEERELDFQAHRDTRAAKHGTIRESIHAAMRDTTNGTVTEQMQAAAPKGSVGA